MGAQFYPNYIQIRVTAGGITELPSGIALPGVYDPEHEESISLLVSYMSKRPPQIGSYLGRPIFMSTRSVVA
ncbi:hypothetical protein GGR53DRAFT_504351 [Hypoxylon sp. FL1150]|nr:hypothetical protein GGR53DRAFT_504351 [Hypoxylon sp. FL1150]